MKTNRFLLVAALAAAHFAGCMSAKPPDALTDAEFIAVRAAGKVNMNGADDEAFWADAPEYRLDRDPFNPAPVPLAGLPEFATSVKFAWDENAFHVLFRGKTFGLEEFDSGKYSLHDSLIYESDCCEIFVDAAGDGMRYIELQASPYNTTADYLHTFKKPPVYPADRLDREFCREYLKSDRTWNALDFRAASVIEKSGETAVRWSCEMSVSWEDISGSAGDAPEPGQSLYVNALRYVWFERAGKRLLSPVMTGRTMHGCPHLTPMALRRLILAE